MHQPFDPTDYLPVTTINTSVSRRSANKKTGEIIEDDVVMINADSSCDETESEAGSNYDDAGMDMLDTTREEKLEQERTVLKQKICVAVSGVEEGIQKEWIVVDYPRKQFSAQFIQQEEVQVHMFKRSTSNVNWFVWPELCGEEPNIGWIYESMFHFLISLSLQFLISCNVYNSPINVLCKTSKKEINK